MTPHRGHRCLRVEKSCTRCCRTVKPSGRLKGLLQLDDPSGLFKEFFGPKLTNKINIYLSGLQRSDVALNSCTGRGGSGSSRSRRLEMYCMVLVISRSKATSWGIYRSLLVSLFWGASFLQPQSHYPQALVSGSELDALPLR
jgi:hypothetical protein